MREHQRIYKLTQGLEFGLPMAYTIYLRVRDFFSEIIYIFKFPLCKGY
jgi:hypothetical protein